jgi:SulP family sulfate permease
MVLDLHHVINVDTTGLETLDVLRRTLARRDATLLLCDVNEQPRSLMQRTAFDVALGGANLLPDIPAALLRAAEVVRETAGGTTVRDD